MSLTSRFFVAGTTYTLCAFEVTEGSEWSPPEGSHVMHVEPIIEDGAVDGLYLWALVPTSKMAQAIGPSNGT